MGERDGDGVDDQLARLGRLVDDETVGDGSPEGLASRLQGLCVVLTRVLPVSGAGVSVLTQDGIDGGMAAAWGPNSRAIEELQFSFGEGPCMEAFSSCRPALEPDLSGRGMQRWPVYAPAAHDYGVRAVFAFPLQVGAARLGALDIYCAEPGPLSAETLSQSVMFADIATAILLEGEATARGQLVASANDVLGYRTEVYQAQGMVTVELGLSLAEALARLRAHAYAQGRPLLDVARDVVAGTLKLDRDTP